MPIEAALRRAALTVVFGVAAVMFGVVPSRAETLTTLFPAFMHVGPGYQYAVSDEVPTKTKLDVSGCQDGWCQIRYGRAYGWVTRSILNVAPPPVVPGGAARPVECFDFVRTGWPHGGDLDNLCIYEPAAGGQIAPAQAR